MTSSRRASTNPPVPDPRERGEDILAGPSARRSEGLAIGRSREGRALRAFRFGTGPRRVSLVAGCHADEPTGPRLLRHLCGFLGALAPEDPLLSRFEWWIVPHANPDGEARNRAWHADGDAAYDVAAYLAGAVRELPGDDVEFGFPSGTAAEDPEVRPENRALFDWWFSAEHPFTLHVSLHGMAFAAGPWFLIEPAWADRCDPLKARCRTAVSDLGYVLHDVERGGEKGFRRLGRGFCTRPDSRAMRDHFLSLGDPETASRFRSSSMEAVRSLGGDPLTLVSEMPLFVLPGVGETLGPPDPAAEEWKRRLASWHERLGGGEDPVGVRAEARAAGLRAMPVRDQMRLQWTLIAAGLELTAIGGTRAAP